MKTIYQIFIIIFVATSLLLVKDDFFNFSESLAIYVTNKLSTILDIKDDTVVEVKNDINVDGIKDIIDLPKKVEEPGALKVSEKRYVTNLGESYTSNLSLQNIINITNKYRKIGGNLNVLTENQKLNFSAQKKLEDMFKKQYFEHISPSDIGVSDLVNQVSYEYITVGENLAMGNFSSDQALVDAWMESIGHRENILNKYYTEIGVAVALGTFEGKNVWVAVQHLGLPKSFCPKIDDLLYGVINIEQKQIKSIEDDIAIRLQKIEDRVVYEGLTTNEQIDKYNGMIVVYNQLVSSLKEKINTYNDQVQDFNSCFAKNTPELNQ